MALSLVSRLCLRSGLGLAALVAAPALASAQGEFLFEGTADTPDDNYGVATDVAGDIDGDGILDFVVGAFLDPAGGSDAGAAYILSGADGSVLRTFNGGPNDRLGYEVAGVGDVDDDGVVDVAVTADGNEAVYVFSGSDGSTLHTFLPDAPEDNIGWSLAPAGDINGDDHADIAVGSPGNDLGGLEFGLVRIYSGADGSVLREWPGTAGSIGFGFALDLAGRVDGDGIDDFIVGYQSIGNRADVISGADGSLIHTWSGDAVTDWFGTAVAGIGDADLDGFGDLAVGASTSFIDDGYVRLFSGQTGAEILTILGDSAIELFGLSVSQVGDVNGDGRADVLAGAPFANAPGLFSAGRAAVHSGLDGSLLIEIFGTEDDAALGWSVAGAPFANLIAGAPAALGGGFASIHDSGRSTRPFNYCDLVPTSQTAGGRIVATGSGSLALDNVSLTAVDLPTGQFGYFLMSEVEALILNPGGSEGNLCIGSPLVRLLPPVLNSGPGGSFSYDLELSNVPQVGSIAAGETWHFQSWFRDGQASNFPDGVRITFAP